MMMTGLGAGIAWGVETFILGLVLAKSPFCSMSESIFLAPFISTFFHDGFAAIWMLLFNLFRGEINIIRKSVKTKYGLRVLLGTLLGGPIGMSSYVLCIKYLGVSIGTITTSIYPAIGAVFACIFLKEKMQWYRWVFLSFSIIGVAMLGYSPEMTATNFVAGVIAALVYSITMSIENLIVKDALAQPSMKGNIVLQIREISSCLLTGIFLIFIPHSIGYIVEIFTVHSDQVLLTIAGAAFFGVVSYLLFAKALIKIGVAKTLALNGTYCVWAMILEVLILKNTALLNPMTIIAAFLIVIFGILTAVDYKELFFHYSSI